MVRLSPTLRKEDLMAFDIGPLGPGESQGAKRLLALAAYLETVPQAEYDHRTCRRRRTDGSWAMCAIGHGISALPEVIGLRWRNAESQDVVRLDGSGATEHEFALIAEAFDLNPEDTAMIFGVGLNTVNFYGPQGIYGLEPSAVARAIRAFALTRLAAVAP
jgi:hypothetical protein